MKTPAIITLLALSIMVLMATKQLSAQTAPGFPQRTATVQATQSLNFGDFTLVSAGSSGGNVIVDYQGQRSATGDVILLNMSTSAHAAIFEYKLCPGRRVTITYPVSINLAGDNGGTMRLILGETSKGANGSSFTSNSGCDDIHQISIGGTLEVSNLSTNPAGLYSGSFNITFIQE